MQVIIEHDVWINSQLSIARHYGGIVINNEQFYILPPNGDLVNAKYVKLYRQLGREKLQEYIDKGLTLNQIKDECKNSTQAPQKDSEPSLL